MPGKFRMPLVTPNAASKPENWFYPLNAPSCPPGSAQPPFGRAYTNFRKIKTLSNRWQQICWSIWFGKNRIGHSNCSEHNLGSPWRSESEQYTQSWPASSWSSGQSKIVNWQIVQISYFPSWRLAGRLGSHKSWIAFHSADRMPADKLDWIDDT